MEMAMTTKKLINTIKKLTKSIKKIVKTTKKITKTIKKMVKITKELTKTIKKLTKTTYGNCLPNKSMNAIQLQKKFLPEWINW